MDPVRSSNKNNEFSNKERQSSPSGTSDDQTTILDKTSNGMEATIYDTKGNKSGSITLPESVFGLPWNADLVHQVANSMRGNMRTSTAHTKNRGEVSGGGKKPWKQKGTGRARHGSTRSPIWVGGGITHGPRNERNFKTEIPRKMRAKALYTALSQKFKEGKIGFISGISLTTPKTKEAVEILNNLKKVPELSRILSRNNAAYISIPTHNEAVWKSFRNIGSVQVSPISDLNVLDVLQYKNLIIVDPETSVSILAKKLAKKVAGASKEAKTKKPAASKLRKVASAVKVRKPAASVQSGSASGRKK